MAVRLVTIKNTNQETIIKWSSSAAETGTITLANLTAATQVRNSASPTVNIVKIYAAGELGSHIRITRNGALVFACAPENAPVMNFSQDGFTDSDNNTSDIVIDNNSAKDSTGYIVLRKIAGWDTTVENATYGAYDDPTRRGASTTMSGSPDKV